MSTTNSAECGEAATAGMFNTASHSRLALVQLKLFETEIINRWKNRLSEHAPGFIASRFGGRSWFGPWRKVAWSLRESSQESALKDALARTGGAEDLLAEVPVGRQLLVRVMRGGRLIACLHAQFLFDPLLLAGGAAWESCLLDLHAATARVEEAVGVPCYHAFAGVLPQPVVELPERTVLVQWRPDSKRWDYAESHDTADLWRLFYPHTDQECLRRLQEGIAGCEPKLTCVPRLSEAAQLSERQVEDLCRGLPNVRLFESNGLRMVEMW